MDLPIAFQDKMKLLLKDEYEAFAQSYEKERVQGLRFNTLKAGIENASAEAGKLFQLKKIPWI